jgi:hypothetical protein
MNSAAVVSERRAEHPRAALEGSRAIERIGASGEAVIAAVKSRCLATEQTLAPAHFPSQTGIATR